VSPGDADSQVVAKALNSHGYSFQQAVLDLCEKDRPKRVVGWWFEVAEFPVETKGYGTRIDFVLRYGNRDCFITAECKRALGARWCFAKAKYSRRHATGLDVVAERITFEFDDPDSVESMGWSIGTSHDVYQIGVVATRSNKGGGRDDIEDAASQCMKGLNGMINFFQRNVENSRLFRNGEHVTILPVVFTTADLLVTDADLAAADLKTGGIGDEVPVERRDWLCFEYNLSPGLKHEFSPRDRAYREIYEIAFCEFVRTIFIVRPEGISNFFDTLERDYLQRT
jgi:hypothetical protein